MGRIKIHAVGSTIILSRVTFIFHHDFVVKGDALFFPDDVANGHSSFNRSFVSVRGKGKRQQVVSWLLSIQFQTAI
jgi:hypothetical protein